MLRGAHLSPLVFGWCRGLALGRPHAVWVAVFLVHYELSDIDLLPSERRRKVRHANGLTVAGATRSVEGIGIVVEKDLQRITGV